MTTEFKQVGLIAKDGDQRIVETLQGLSNLLEARGVEFALEGDTGRILDHWPHAVASLEQLGRDCDLIIVVGGDGTLLHTARALADHPVPMAGINLGRLGFLTDISAERAAQDIERILDGHYRRDDRPMVDGTIHRDGTPLARDLALNDVVLHKADGGRMIEFETWVDGTFVSLHRADGMIAATATGSTAYALSGGGPILHPDLGGLTLVPICPHTLSDRPLVVPDSYRVELVLRGHSEPEGQVHWDGQQRSPMAAGDRLEIRHHGRRTTLLHPPGYDYFALLRSKLHWGRAQDGGVPR